METLCLEPPYQVGVFGHHGTSRTERTSTAARTAITSANKGGNQLGRRRKDARSH
jgi:hypothetical protein